MAALPYDPPDIGAVQLTSMLLLPIFFAITLVGSSGKKTNGLASLLLKNFTIPL